jgi:poly(A) polymerase
MIRQTILKPDLENVVLSLVETCDEIYLVGGAIRDYLTGSECHDIDFVVKENAIRAAKRTADNLNGKFYILDAERKTGRVLLSGEGKTAVIDFATMTGSDIYEDLKARDFTFNAIALDVTQPEKLIDPLNGESDLKAGILRLCSSASFDLDPVRVIRAVRFQVLLNQQLDDTTKESIRKASRRLGEVSSERKRDEIFHVFESGHIAKSCDLLREYGIWNKVFPCLDRIEGEIHFLPHVHTLLGHTLQVLNYVEFFLHSIRSNVIDTENRNLRSGCELLSEFRIPLVQFLSRPIHPQRQYDGLIDLGILYHDIGKTILLQEGCSDFEKHAAASADFFRTIAPEWSLSRDEVSFVERFIRNHSIQYPVTDPEMSTSRLAVYRFFKQAREAGVMLAIFYLADILSAYEDTVTEERWQRALRTSHTLLDCWFNHYNEVINPTEIIGGDEVMEEFHLRSGKIIGDILESIREAQAGGIVNSKDDAFECARAVIERSRNA